VASFLAPEGEFGADQCVNQGEEGQVHVQLGVNPPGLLHGHDDLLSPGVARDEEDDHNDLQYPGAEQVDLKQKSMCILQNG
jgi:hypothetical protein